MILSDGFWKWEIPLSHTHQHAHTKLERFRLDLQIQFSSSATQSYRSKVKAYERQKGFLGDVAIEMTCHSESRVSSMAEEVGECIIIPISNNVGYVVPTVCRDY